MSYPDSVNDQPSHVDSNGNKFWYQYGNIHRDGDKPAVEWTDGDKSWYQNGKRHRDGDKPAVEFADGYRAWFQNGKRHRDGDKPAVEWADGDRAWYRNGVEYYPDQIMKQEEKIEIKQEKAKNDTNEVCYLCGKATVPLFGRQMICRSCGK